MGMIKKYATISDDEQAMTNCRGLRETRIRKLHMSQSELGAECGVSASSISKAEIYPDQLLAHTYNSIARFMGWPAYEKGRKIINVKMPEESRQAQIDFMNVLLETTPAEGFNAWFDSLDAELTSQVNSIADLIDKSPSDVVVLALRKLITKREAKDNDSPDSAPRV